MFCDIPVDRKRGRRNVAGEEAAAQKYSVLPGLDLLK
jgi:hypothetical protein